MPHECQPHHRSTWSTRSSRRTVSSQVEAYRTRIPEQLLDQDQRLTQSQFTPAGLRTLEDNIHATRALPIEQRPQPAATDEYLALTLDHIARRRAIATS